ncbi:MAG: hypothetical protein EX254_10930, partial [Flavobacteriaceae bacterium]
MDDLPIFIEKMKARLKYMEGKSYSQVNPNTKALGRYQFHPKYWWKPIQDFAKEKKYNQAKPITKEYFLQNKKLQDEFFANYVKEDMLPFVKNIQKHNKRNLPIDVLGQLYHWNPDSVKTYVQGGEWKIPNQENNMSLDEALTRGEQGMQESGFSSVSKADIMTVEERENKAKEFFERKDALKKQLDSGEMSPGAFDTELYDLTKEYAKDGLAKAINNETTRRNTAKENKYNSERASFQQLYKNLLNTDNNNLTRRWDPKKKVLTLSATNKKGKAILDGFEKASGNKLRVHKPTGKGAPTHQRYAIDFSLQGKGQNGKYLIEGINKYASNIPEGKEWTTEELTGNFNLETESFGSNPNPYLTADLLFEKNIPEDQLDQLILSADYPKLTANYGDLKKEDAPATTASSEKSTATASKPAETAEEELTREDIMQFYGEMDAPEVSGYNPKDYKKEIPFGAIANGFLGYM